MADPEIMEGGGGVTECNTWSLGHDKGEGMKRLIH